MYTEHLSLKSDCSTRWLTTNAHTGIPLLREAPLGYFTKFLKTDNFSEELAYVHRDLHHRLSLSLCWNNKALHWVTLTLP